MRVSSYPAPLASLFLLSFTLFVFAAALHAPPFLRWIALPAFLAAAFLTASILLRPGFQQELWELFRWPGRHLIIFSVAVMLSFLLAIRYRIAENMPPVPIAVEPFVLVSVMIGMVEEVLFRGIIQGEAGKWRISFSVYFSAFVFAGYKALLFIWPSPQNQVSAATLFLWTLPAGVLLGYARQKSHSLWPPLLAHGLFDLYVYMETASAPWWLW